MATSEKSQHEFVIGNKSQELFEIVISVCDPRKDNSRFPAYVREELGGEMIRVAREIMRCCLFANGCRDVDRANCQRDAYNNIVYLNFLTRTAYDKGWINAKPRGIGVGYWRISLRREKSRWIKRRFAIGHGDNMRMRETVGILY